MTQRFSATPNPTRQGETVTICYTVTGATLPVTIAMHFDPTGTIASETITEEDVGEGFTKVCFDVQIPTGCHGLLLVDESNQSDDMAVTVRP